MFVLIASICIGFFSAQVSGVPIACPDGWTGFESYCYQANDQIVTWSQAQAFCVERGGDLVKITNARENDFVLALARRDAPSAKQVWIGLHWYSNSNLFMWSDYSVPIYVNWSGGEPNGMANEPCINMWTRRTDHLSRASGTWNDLRCDVSSVDPCGLVCKRLP